jgi:hypothetical protein
MESFGGRAGKSLASMIDRDGDGSILEDVAGMLFQGSDSQTSGGGILRKLLGGLFGRR